MDDKRFEFGKNWKRFISEIDEERIDRAVVSLKNGLNVDALERKTFLDIGCGSGLFSLAAKRMKAFVHSFDYDRDSVYCARELKKRFYSDNKGWIIEQGSILDKNYLKKLGQFDIIYSWGVLHHTGKMWEALGNVVPLLKPQGKLFIAIYNHQLYWSYFYRFIKKLYVSSPVFGKWIIAGSYISFQFVKGFIKDILLFRNPFERYRERKKTRGMSMFIDWIDWIGGYPFEVAKPEEIFRFYHTKGLELENLKTCGSGRGCNEFVFIKKR
ncbi:MAG: methyltransferase domain-containing protein [Candidatus Aureabacteria bacterium]|nr:methyltransferase domain-containing protein [Candidatus Auribacterota bacterium]